MAMEKTSGIPLSLTGNNIWRGGNKSNGKLQLLHNFHLTTGYARIVIQPLLQTELDAAGAIGVPFGNGVWYDRTKKSTEPGVIYAGVPTAGSPTPKLAGVLAYEAGLASGMPAANNGIQPMNKGKLIKRGFVMYKTGKAAAAGAAIAYSGINDATMYAFVENATGDPVFAAQTSYSAAGVPVLANCTYLGNIVHLEPENESWLVELKF